MSIILKIILGLVILIGIVLGGLVLLYIIIIVHHEITWRKKIDDNYNEREKEHQAQE